VTALKQADCLRLFALLKSGDEEALTRLVEYNLPLVHACLKRFRSYGRDMEELYQQGCLGLVKACRRFDPDYGVCFSTYAVPLILGEIRRFLRDDHPLHLARQDKERLARVPKASAALTQALGREPTIHELAQVLRMDANELVWLMESRSPAASLDQSEGDERPLNERIGGSDPQMDILLLKDMIQRLPPQSRQVIYHRFRAGRTQAQTAQILGVSQVQVSRLERRIRHTLKEQWHTG